MGNTIPTLIALGFIAFLFLTQGTIFQQLKEKLIPLSSIIRGKVSTKFKFGAIYAVLEGIWKDEKVKVELKKVANWRHPGELFITFYNPRNWPFSLKIKPLRKNIFDTMKTPIVFFVSGCKFKMIEEEIEVVADIDDKIRIREFLNS